jgi:hypothetical protein
MGTLKVKVTDAGGTRWVDVVNGAGMRSGFRRRATVAPTIPHATVTPIAFNTLMDTGQFIYTTNGAFTTVTVPVAGIFNIHGNVASANSLWPTGTYLMLMVNSAVVARVMASRDHTFEDIRISHTLPLLVGSTVGLSIYHEGGTNYTDLRVLATDSSLDPVQPALSCWRVSY